MGTRAGASAAADLAPPGSEKVRGPLTGAWGVYREGRQQIWGGQRAKAVTIAVREMIEQDHGSSREAFAKLTHCWWEALAEKKCRPCLYVCLGGVWRSPSSACHNVVEQNRTEFPFISLTRKT